MSPVIQTYESNVKPSAEISQVEANPVAMSQGWKGLEAISQGVSNLNDQVSDAIFTVQERQNKIAAYDAANQYQREITHRSIKAKEIEGNSVNDYSSITGKDEDNTMDIYTGESNQLPGIREQFAQKLDPKARVIFEHLANGTDESYRGMLATHQATETRAYNAAVVKDTFEIAKQNILENPSDQNIETQIQKVKDIISLHTGKADKELAEKMEADLRGAARGKRTSNMVTTEVVALQREYKMKFPDDPVRALDEALTYATSPEWREDAMNRGIDEPAQQRIVSQLNSSLVQQNHLYKNNADKKLTEFMLLLDGNGVDKSGKPLPSWKEKIDSFIFGKDSGLNGEDQKKFLHMANEKIDREVKEIKLEQSEKAKAIREERSTEASERAAAAASRAARAEERRLKAEKEKADRDAKKDSALQDIISGKIKDPIEIARIPGMDVDTMKALTPVLKEVSGSIHIKDAYKTVDAFVKANEKDPIKQKQLLSEMNDKLQSGLAGKSDPAEIKKITDELVTEKKTHFFKDVLEGVGNFFKPKDSSAPKKMTEGALRADLAAHQITGKAADDYIRRAIAAGKL